MAILAKGTTFVTGDQVSASSLNALVDSATFASGAVDSSSTALSGGAITVKDGGVTMAKLESATNGQLPIGNGTGFTKATLTAGTNIGITNGSGTVTVAFSGTLPVANGGTGVTTLNDVRSQLGINTPARCTAQSDATSTTFVDATGMSVNLVSGTTYLVEINAFIGYVGDGTSTPDLKITGTATASSVVGHYYAGRNTFSVGATGTSLPVTLTQILSAANTGGSALKGLARVFLTIVCNGSGTLKLQIAQNAGSATTSVLTSSYMNLFAY
jgi:hypothetical protein